MTRFALQNAASVAGLMLTTDAMVADLPHDDKNHGSGGMGGAGMGMGGMATWACDADATSQLEGRGPDWSGPRSFAVISRRMRLANSVAAARYAVLRDEHVRPIVTGPIGRRSTGAHDVSSTSQAKQEEGAAHGQGEEVDQAVKEARKRTGTVHQAIDADGRLRAGVSEGPMEPAEPALTDIVASSSAVESPPALPGPVLQASINVRSTSLAVLALLAVIGFFLVARAVLIPITIAVLASYALTPIVDWLRRTARLPKALGAALTLALMLVGLGFGIESLQSQAIQILDIVPRATDKFSTAIRRSALGPPGAVEKIRKAASEIEKAATAAATPSNPPARAPVASGVRTPASSAGINIWDYVLMGTASALAGIGQLVVVIALVYFLLIAGDSFRRTLMRISGNTLSKKKITLQILDEIDSQIQRYLLVQVATSAMLGVVAWLVFAWIGLENALFWGFLGGVLHLVPYAGPTAFVLLVGLVAYAQFESLQPVVLVIGSMLTLVGVIGLLLVPWLTQRVGRLNAVTVFVSLLVWGWLWGIWGLLLGVPIVMAINAVCERIEDLRPISEFLGYGPREA